jgi:magnesium-protoporphyrin IX monomethyl ester (oxidative) cyclase
LGVSVAEYDRKVLQITSDISKQVFPFTINLDDDRLWAGFERLREISDEVEAAKVQGGLFSLVKRSYLAANAALVFARIYMLPVVPNELPADIRMAPAW